MDRTHRQRLCGGATSLVIARVRYHGVLGPCASERDRIVSAGEGARRAQSALSPEFDITPDRVESDPGCAATSVTPEAASIELLGSKRERALPATPPAIPVAHADTPPNPDAARARRLAWAERMKRVFAIDVLECLRCRGPMPILAAIHPPATTSAMTKRPSKRPPTSSSESSAAVHGTTRQRGSITTHIRIARPSASALHRRASQSNRVRPGVSAAPPRGAADRFFPQPLALPISQELS